MTDKQMIIDGVDVSGCNFTLERDGKIKCECTHATGFGVICDCECWKTCDYKNYKRKEQECETLASQLDFEVQKKECLEQECEELKKQLIQKDEVNTFFNTLDWNSDPCEICPKKNCLDEIEEIVNFISNITNCDKAYYCKDKLDEILQKISECGGGK